MLIGFQSRGKAGHSVPPILEHAITAVDDVNLHSGDDAKATFDDIMRSCASAMVYRARPPMHIRRDLLGPFHGGTTPVGQHEAPTCADDIMPVEDGPGKLQTAWQPRTATRIRLYAHSRSTDTVRTSYGGWCDTPTRTIWDHDTVGTMAGSHLPWQHNAGGGWAVARESHVHDLDALQQASVTPSPHDPMSIMSQSSDVALQTPLHRTQASTWSLSPCRTSYGGLHDTPTSAHSCCSSLARVMAVLPSWPTRERGPPRRPRNATGASAISCMEAYTRTRTSACSSRALISRYCHGVQSGQWS